MANESRVPKVQKYFIPISNTSLMVLINLKFHYRAVHQVDANENKFMLKCYNPCKVFYQTIFKPIPLQYLGLSTYLPRAQKVSLSRSNTELTVQTQVVGPLMAVGQIHPQKIIYLQVQNIHNYHLCKTTSHLITSVKHPKKIDKNPYGQSSIDH